MFLFKLYNWTIFTILIPGAFALMTAFGMFEYRGGGYFNDSYGTHDGVGALAILAGIFACYGIIQLLITYSSMAEIQSVLNKQSAVIDVYKGQLADMESASKAVVTDTKGEGTMAGSSLPAAALVQQIGELRERVADAEATRAKAEVDLEEWLLGPLRSQARYFHNVVAARSIMTNVKPTRENDPE